MHFNVNEFPYLATHRTQHQKQNIYILQNVKTYCFNYKMYNMFYFSMCT